MNKNTKLMYDLLMYKKYSKLCDQYFSWYNNMFRNTRQEICMCVVCWEDMTNQLEGT